MAGYGAPESRCAQPSRRATAAAVEDFPDAAGPSMAMTRSVILPPSPCPDSSEVGEESRVADGDGSPFREPDLCPGDGAEHRERHGQPMVARRVHASTRRLIRAAHQQILTPDLGGDSKRAQIGRNELQPVALLHPELPHLPE